MRARSERRRQDNRAPPLRADTPRGDLRGNERRGPHAGRHARQGCAGALGAGAVHRSALAAETAIVDQLRDRDAILIVDEAQHLAPPFLDELRCIRDIARCGLALAGDDLLWTALKGCRCCKQIVGRIGGHVHLEGSVERRRARARGGDGRFPAQGRDGGSGATGGAEAGRAPTRAGGRWRRPSSRRRARVARSGKTTSPARGSPDGADPAAAGRDPRWAEGGLADDDYRAILHRAAGVASARQLDSLGFELVIEQFTSLGWRPSFRPPYFGRRPGMASPGQVTLIPTRWDRYTRGEGVDLTLGKWLNRTLGVALLRRPFFRLFMGIFARGRFLFCSFCAGTELRIAPTRLFEA